MYKLLPLLTKQKSASLVLNFLNSTNSLLTTGEIKFTPCISQMTLDIVY